MSQAIIWIGLGIGLAMFFGGMAKDWLTKKLAVLKAAAAAAQATTSTPAAPGPTHVSADERLILLASLLTLRDRLETTDSCAELIDKNLIPAVMAQKKV